jgi:hypothetical protein
MCSRAGVFRAPAHRPLDMGTAKLAEQSQHVQGAGLCGRAAGACTG